MSSKDNKGIVINSDNLQRSSRLKGGLNVKYIGRGSGFPSDFRPVGVDEVAYELTRKHFGKGVDGLVNKYHRSPMSLEALTQDLFAYERNHVKRLTDPVYYMALESIRDDLKDIRIKPISYRNVVNLPDFPSNKSPGLPYIHQGIHRKSVAIEKGALKEITNTWKEISWGKNVPLPDACLFARSQVYEKPKERIRATWGFPLAVYMEEARFFYPIQKALTDGVGNFPIAYGFEMAVGGMVAIDEMVSRHPGKSILCTDWSGFDKGVAPWMLRDIFSIIEEMIDFGVEVDHDGKERSVRKTLQVARWQRLVNYFINTPIRTARGDRYRVEGGVPSGSCFTNLVDSIANAIISRYMIYHTTGFFPLEELYMGDDAILVCSGMVNLIALSKLALDDFGFTMSTMKSHVTKNTSNTHFLGYWNRGGVPFKPQDMLLIQYVHPERRMRTHLERATSALGQMLAGFDPYYGAKWFEVISDLATLSQYTEEPFTIKDVVTRTDIDKSQKWLKILGFTDEHITVPEPIGGYSYKLLAPLQPKRRMKTRFYDLERLKERVGQKVQG